MKAASSLLATLPSFFAAVPDTPAGRAGYFIGVGVGIFLMFCLLVFGVFAVIMALVRRTTGWVVTGSIFGVLGLAFSVLCVVGFTRGFKKGFNEGAAASRAVQTVTGNVLPFTIQVPFGWSLKRNQNDFDTIATRGSSYIGVVAEEADLGTSEVIAKLARQRIEDNGADVEMSENDSITIDGREWLQFTAKCKVSLVPIAYQFYVHSGNEGTFQIIGWTAQNLWDRDSAKLRASMLTFRFPKPTSEPQDATTPVNDSK